MPPSDIEHWPRLTRFYGITPSELAKLPNAVTSVYMDALPVLEAEEQLERIQASSFPHYVEGDQKRIRRQLLRVGEIEEPVRALNPTGAPGAHALGGLGIRVVMEPPKPKPEEVPASA